MLEGIYLAIQGAASQGIIWGIMTLGVYITFKVLDFPDLTVDGSFALGGAVSAILISNGMNPFITLFFSFLLCYMFHQHHINQCIFLKHHNYPFFV